MIQYQDFQRRYPHAPQQILDILSGQVRQGDFILKQNVQDFELALADEVGAKHAVCVSSATSAMTLSLIAAGIGPGDEVITPAFCYVSAASAIVRAGATPVFVDVQPSTCMLDAQAVAEAVTAKTRAVLVAHLFSGVADIDAIRNALPDRVLLLEDSATAFGARLRGRSCGALGDVGVYSFFPAKPLGGLGDGGAVVTNDDQLAHTVRMLRNHGQDGKRRFYHQLLGMNSRMDEVNAAWLLCQLPDNARQLARKQAIARRYDQAIEASGLVFAGQERGSADFSPHAYVLRSTQREQLSHHLSARSIQTKVHFPVPLPAQPAFAAWSQGSGSYPVAAMLARQCLALPLCPGMHDKQVSHVVTALEAFSHAHAV
ncbi:TPA: DegT/DnrJ/EryC1/StrS family aminotransferase [Pseudomonas putida]|uniref:DegT/DnrJ/EryC1/StrS family aminotransferase n=1 Tax=Pseudomonas TaxID=286 RepID=UPI00110C9ED4|nr:MULTISPECIES: DegT/DnrJ/EryC1/StrS family aminotransferase [Pseudomonas]MDD1995065.1 DegT/DnrJ/EryC1/StrS family aminotransferase [Pseudomonas putida]HDS0919418.1 DegT/DnrJ/EryC1/StrS family aminotransferase [Pseudomonas putida]HDS0933806.1 DegT/DnrJ/EryC1/StrS family aminotransferase [Pseudomonas putida]HDS1783918.1 DegT/DnrJ/EryC1/StrS family aminotransferase [Pseudomonas putida]HDS3799720.1 DegT/DnrJ/EryC1/StrS family aminotransferase [Pseudomonas putida]